MNCHLKFVNVWLIADLMFQISTESATIFLLAMMILPMLMIVSGASGVYHMIHSFNSID